MRKRDFPGSYPLLGLLTFGPQTGYDLCKTAEATLAPFWHEGFAQIYASLEVFESRGLAEVVAAETGARRRRVYAVTEQGRKEFGEWLARPVETVDYRRHELLVKVFFGRLMDPGVLAGHLKAYGEAQGRWRASLEELGRRLAAQEPGNPDLPYWLATVDHGICLARALEAWSSQTLVRP